MSDKLPVISGKELVALLEKCGFEIIRIKGSHHRMKHTDGRITTVPVHKNDPLPKGLLRKIIREDLLINLEEFNRMLK
ncbi:MAG TPA: type II toxin-antitoxin system HicA family toxin [Mucilaginibacter sp.]|jgi:predicted RNA binding protein YcfA (HicA-like mRNA interferase family)|nr:type II toxin-antitoxin system HicA family toxin [Mucilaginibacter sp.]